MTHWHVKFREGPDWYITTDAVGVARLVEKDRGVEHAIECPSKLTADLITGQLYCTLRPDK
jgi:hypothetical protein